MEIPYEVKPRPDTGLWNAKIGIWLFLASEVMLFGGLFSGYVFLRLGSGAEPDYHWPHGLLDVKLGLINTLVLIASSVFIVMAWVRLKLRDWNGFRNWMIAVLLCALGFLGIKSYEYYTKFTHFGAKLADKTIIEGHHLKDVIAYDEISQVSLDLRITDFRLSSIVHGDARGNLHFNVQDGLIEGEKIDSDQFFETAYDGLFAGKGHKLTEGEAASISEAYEKVEENTSSSFELTSGKIKQIRTSIDAHRKSQRPPMERVRKLEYAAFRDANRGALSDELEAKRLQLARKIKWYPKNGISALTLVPVGKDSAKPLPFSILTKRSKLRSMSEQGGTLHDQTVFVGKLSAEKRFLFLNVDNIDLRSTPVPENSLIWKYMDHHAKDAFLAHRDEVNAEAKEKGKEPDIAESLRMHQHKVEHGGEKHYPEVKIPFDEVTLYSSFTPKWNTYLAVYFTLTGLHGLHVLIGALVLSYFLFFGKKMFDTDPEHLANRVEVGGLFWHFVDLVWIFLFPILYLM